ncbi:MAG: methyl-accepting chemotaxis protein [Candidatus Moduliflexus flocculans]|nr:methyl-accepting chemotaxis protein [Candidatus Moduliflexus flocculans]
MTASAVALSSSAEEMNSSTEEIAGTVEQIAKGAEHQASLVEQTSKLMREMAGAITEIASRAKAAAEAAAEAGYTAQTGGKSAREAMDKMKGVFGIVEGAAGRVKALIERTQQIGTIVDVITKIAQQTNLLALNATIEAARAGEAGRGFAVVAEEVRKLATETATSAEKIADMVKEVQTENSKVVGSMEVATRDIASGREVLTYTSDALEEIVRGVVEEVKKVQEISALTQQQTEGAQALVKTIDEIAKVAEDNAASTEEASAATTEQTASMEQMAHSAQQLERSWRTSSRPWWPGSMSDGERRSWRPRSPASPGGGGDGAGGVSAGHPLPGLRRMVRPAASIYVREVQPLERVTRVPNAPRAVLGILNIRGRVLTLFGLAGVSAEIPAGSTPARTWWCWIWAMPELRIGVAVQRDRRCPARFPVSARGAAAAAGRRAGTVLEGVFEVEGHVVGLLDLAARLRPASLRVGDHARRRGRV